MLVIRLKGKPKNKVIWDSYRMRSKDILTFKFAHLYGLNTKQKKEKRSRSPLSWECLSAIENNFSFLLTNEIPTANWQTKTTQ